MAINRETIGVVLVHGIGEQSAGDHLKSEAANLLAAAENKHGWRVWIDPLVSGEAPGRLKAVLTRQDRTVELDFREVYWADLDEQATPGSEGSFWYWALSMWAVRRFSKATIADPNEPASPDLKKMGVFEPTTGRRETITARLRLFLVACVFVPVLGLLTLTNFVLKKLGVGRIPGPDTLYEFIADVRLLQQDRWLSMPSLKYMADRPRDAVRRRAVRRIVEMAGVDFDRWYVLAHSLGTIVAWNALMADERALARFLTEDEWKKAKAFQKISTKPEEDAPRFPRRPVWLTADDALDRKLLFDKMSGLLTYGSPLDKFAFMFPRLVRSNTSDVWKADGFEWINLYDPVDPVAAELDAGNWRPSHLSPRNFAYHAHWILLLNHIKYMVAGRDLRSPAAEATTRWMLRDELDLGAGTSLFDQARMADAHPRWLKAARSRRLSKIRLLQWAAVFIVCVLVVTQGFWFLAPQWLIDLLPAALTHAVGNWGVVSHYVIGATIPVVVCLTLGAGRWIGDILRRKRRKELQDQHPKNAEANSDNEPDIREAA